ncbi:MAG: hypothetical protein ACXVH0_00050 [Thermoanaerobaculia bacterium]
MTVEVNRRPERGGVSASRSPEPHYLVAAGRKNTIGCVFHLKKEKVGITLRDSPKRQSQNDAERKKERPKRSRYLVEGGVRLQAEGRREKGGLLKDEHLERT